MITKIIAVNWKWNEKLSEPKKYKVESTLDSEVIFTNFKKTGKGIENYIKHISDISKGTAQVLILTHSNPFNNIHKEDLIYNFKEKSNIIIEEIHDGQQKVYIQNGGFLSALVEFEKYNTIILEDLFEKLKIPYEEKIPKERFLNVWDYYWNELGKENLKKKIIDTFLPIAIDIQGLSEIKEDFENSKKYYRDIRTELIKDNRETKYYNSLKDFPKDSPDWKEIEMKLDKEYKDFTPESLIKEIFINKSLTDIFIKKFLDNKSSDFLPAWLKNVIETIDNEIKVTADSNVSGN